MIKTTIVNRNVLFSTFFLISTILSSQTSLVEGELAKKIDENFTSYFIEAVDKYKIPGIAVGVVKGGELIYAKALGYQNLDSKKPMQLNSVFHLASISKLFVATAIMQLQEQGKLTVEDRVVDHLPYFKLKDKRYKEITIQQMLSHVSGMPDVQDYEWSNPVYTKDALENYVKSLSDKKLLHKPGKEFAYSNIAYNVLGDVISKVSGLSFEAYQEQHIFEPLGMSNTTFSKDETIPNNWADPHVRYIQNTVSEVYPYSRKHAPCSALKSNLEDMAKWATVSLNKGILNDKRILNESSYDLMWQEWSSPGENEYVGLAWYKRDFKGYLMLGHTGSDLGFTANFAIFPEKDISIFVMSNLSNSFIIPITSNLYRSALELESTSYVTPAYFTVTDTYASQGFDEAEKVWNDLKLNHEEDYSFTPFRFVMSVFQAIHYDKVKESEQLSRLIKSFHDKKIQKMVIGQAKAYRKEVPNNKAAVAVLKVFEG